MMDLNIESRTIAIVNRLFNPLGKDVGRNTLLLQDLKMNSVARLAFIVDLEDEFDMDISEVATCMFSTVGEFIEHIKTRKSATA